MRWVCQIVLLLLLGACVGVQAQAPGLVSIRFQAVGVDEGLSQVTARTLVQDHEGLIWIGTQDGLNRFDGEDFTVFRRDQQDPRSLTDNHVTALMVDRGGTLWVGTQSGGIGRYDADAGNFVNLAVGPGALAAVQVQALAEDAQGWVWVASGRGHLQRLDPTRSRFEDIVIPANTQVLALLALPDGDVLVGATDGLWRWRARDARLARFAPDIAPRQLTIQALARDARGRFWIGTDAEGVFLVNEAGKLLGNFLQEDGLAGDDVRSLLVDNQARVWIGTYTGLSRIDADGVAPRSWSGERARRVGLSSERVHALIEDRDGQVWVGTWLGGAHFYTPASDAFREFRSQPGEPRALPGNPVRALVTDESDRLWLGVQEGGGLVQFDPEQGVLQRFLPDALDPTSLASDRVQAIARDLDGALWVGYVDAGLDRLPRGATQFQHFPAALQDARAPQHENVLVLYVDRAGTLWIGYQDAGMDSLCRGCTEFRRYRHVPGQLDGLPAHSIGAIHESSRGELWVGARPGGLSRLDRASGKFTPVESLLASPEDAIPRAITAITESRSGELWVGTQGSGVVRLIEMEDGRYRGVAYTHKQGMAADAVGSLIEDARGTMWVSTTLGITRIDPQSGRIENFSARSGAQSDGYFVGAGARLADGTIALGGLRGVTLFHPARVAVRNELRPPVVGDVRVLQSQGVQGQAWRLRRGELRGTADDLWLRAGSGGFGLGFSALAFADPELVQYAYRLDPLDRDWIDTGARQRVASYPHLAPGGYTLRVRARYPGERWSDERRVDVTLDPLWWQTMWARGAVFGVPLALALLWGRNRRLQAQERTRAQAVLAGSEQRLKLALWGTGDEFWDADLASGKLVRMNPLEHLRVTHEARENSLQGYTPFVHEDDLPGFQDALQAHVQGLTDDFDYTYRSQDVAHEWRWLRSRGRSVERDEKGLAVRMAGITQDITELKEFEQTLRRINQQLEERVTTRTAELTRLNADLVHTIEELRLTQHQLVESEKLAALGGLVAGIAHEINTPLGVGVTAASHLEQQARRFEQKLAGGATPTAQDIDAFRSVVTDCSSMVLRNLQRADKMIRSFKQVAVDQASEAARRFDLHAYIDEVLTSLHPALKRGGHSIELDIAPNLMVSTFPGALYQIVANLVMNALTHAFEGREQGTMRLSARVDGDVLYFEFSDDGVGMPEEVRRRIFEPFFTTRRGRGGSGLGMHIVYNLATQRLLGSIECQSTLGEGTRFLLKIPLQSSG